MYTLERTLEQQGWLRIAGVDEAGRGPLAGPVVAAAVILPTDYIIDGIKDSKKCTPRKRRALYEHICARAEVGVGIVDHTVIDEINIYQASRLAMKYAVLDLLEPPQYILIDGPLTLELSIAQQGIIRGDSTCSSIAAASIVAKVTRDELMMKLHQQFPHYAFDKHKGYPTREHVARLEQYGVSSVHRISYRPVQRVLLQS